MRSSLLSFSTLPWINHNPQVAEQLFPATKGCVTIWGHDQMPVWGRFCTSSSQVYGCPLCFGEPCNFSIRASFLRSLGYTSTMPQNLFPGLDFLTHSEWVSANTTAALAAGGFATPVPRAVTLLWILSSRNPSRAKPGISSLQGAEHTALGRLRPSKSVDSSASRETVRLKGNQTSAWHVINHSTFPCLRVLHLNHTLFPRISYWIGKYLKTHGTSWCLGGNAKTFKIPSCCKCYQTYWFSSLILSLWKHKFEQMEIRKERLCE